MEALSATVPVARTQKPAIIPLNIQSTIKAIVHIQTRNSLIARTTVFEWSTARVFVVDLHESIYAENVLMTRVLASLVCLFYVFIIRQHVC